MYTSPCNYQRIFTSERRKRLLLYGQLKLRSHYRFTPALALGCRKAVTLGRSAAPFCRLRPKLSQHHSDPDRAGPTPRLHDSSSERQDRVAYSNVAALLTTTGTSPSNLLRIPNTLLPRLPPKQR